MKHTVNQYRVVCGCRSVGECSHNDFVEIKALKKCVRAFAKEMETKLISKYMRDGRIGWDDPAWTREQILEQLRKHIDKGDMLDVANFAMFAWNQE